MEILTFIETTLLRRMGSLEPWPSGRPPPPPLGVPNIRKVVGNQVSSAYRCRWPDFCYSPLLFRFFFLYINAHCIINPSAMNTVTCLNCHLWCSSIAKTTSIIITGTEIVGPAFCVPHLSVQLVLILESPRITSSPPLTDKYYHQKFLKIFYMIKFKKITLLIRWLSKKYCFILFNLCVKFLHKNVIFDNCVLTWIVSIFSNRVYYESGLC